ncbi:glutamine--fructose-6-phosphate transaminase (isomerizing) [Desulfohalobiaceae bacterium Ax17]|jgi:glucosamine--fructose-6-phosphate aminotransferase (isomerizing)|uniref:glutamine--fructose-6-phosphate transaminase (isomerizing) n=1 Tax=Desulfovulcanus ferrireducens TaxID=2831190 RepID=UPI00207BCDAE|nr:glutamine--fructose-6-phosphate transaminase (isomerizing) [Desulfovulcanus ferrireducens]MBT8762549.1 glutamine--fructose-6-phosphate transaminase (isomerizing) [Desulfovulcanus ferrireducens]
MCGIIAYTGHRPAIPVIVEGLKKLEYRGYDSAGLAFALSEQIHLYRASGKLEALEDRLTSPIIMQPTSGIGHTRWATHGLPNEQNAHPHLDSSGSLALVHNGIIENFQELREELIKEGHQFNSETDTEVLVHLIAKGLQKMSSFPEAISWALSQIEGSYAFALISKDYPGKIWAARQASPLLLGVGTGENFVASDIPAFLQYTKDVVFLEDGELVEMDANSWQVYSVDSLKPVDKQVQHIAWDVQAAQKGGFKHFMLKEIFEQPRVIRDCLAGRIDRKKEQVILTELDDLPVPRRLHIVACGTSYHAGLWAKYLLEKWAHIPVEVEIASEFRYRHLVLNPDELVLAISQSGETADTLAGIRLAKEKGIKVIGLCNVVGSTVARESDRVIYTQAGPEISVASTKAMCSQLVLLYLLTLYWGQRQKVLPLDVLSKSIHTFSSLPDILETELPRLREKAAALSQEYAAARSFFFLGRGINYPLALEGALKLKEISYIHAEGYAAGEMKHGPIALIDPNFPTFALALNDELLPKVKSNLKEVEARGGKIIALTHPQTDLKVDHPWELPLLWGPLNSFMVLPALQLFAYEMAVYLGKDVDQPRNLAKSVTVE